MYFQNLNQTNKEKNYKLHFHIIVHSVKNRLPIYIMHSIEKKWTICIFIMHLHKNSQIKFHTYVHVFSLHSCISLKKMFSLMTFICTFWKNKTSYLLKKRRKRNKRIISCIHKCIFIKRKFHPSKFRTFILCIHLHFQKKNLKKKIHKWIPRNFIKIQKKQNKKQFFVGVA